MRDNPRLASCTLTNPKESGRRVTCILAAEGGLHYIRGNGSPHFTITGAVWRKGLAYETMHMCGCLHELILKKFPRFADLVAPICRGSGSLKH